MEQPPDRRAEGSRGAQQQTNHRARKRRAEEVAETVAIPESPAVADFGDLTGNADKIMETVTFLEQLALSTNLCTLMPRQTARDPPESPPERRLREDYYHLMACDLRLKRPNYDKSISAYKDALIILGKHGYGRLRLIEVHMPERSLRLEARQSRINAIGMYQMHASIIHELIGQPPLKRDGQIELKDLPYKIMELEDNLRDFTHSLGVNLRQHNSCCVADKHYLLDKGFFDPVFAAYPGLAENVWDWLKYAYQLIRPPTDAPLELADIFDVLTVAYVELLSWDATSHRPFQFPDSLVFDRMAIVRLGEEYSYMLYVNAALIVVSECCDISSDWKGHLKQRFFETVSSVSKRRVPLTVAKVGTVAVEFLKRKSVQFEEIHLLNQLNALNSETSAGMFRSRSALRKFCTVLTNNPTKIPLSEIESLEMITGEAAQMMAKFITIIECNRHAMGHRYMDMVRQIHAAAM